MNCELKSLRSTQTVRIRDTTLDSQKIWGTEIEQTKRQRCRTLNWTKMIQFLLSFTNLEEGRGSARVDLGNPRESDRRKRIYREKARASIRSGDPRFDRDQFTYTWGHGIGWVVKERGGVGGRLSGVRSLIDRKRRFRGQMAVGVIIEKCGGWWRRSGRPLVVNGLYVRKSITIPRCHFVLLTRVQCFSIIPLFFCLFFISSKYLFLIHQKNLMICICQSIKWVNSLPCQLQDF